MSKEKSYKILFQKLFLVEGLPEPLKASDSHLQIFDNYIENTRIRLRKIRVPETKSWTKVLEQIYPNESGDYSKIKVSQMFLNDIEYKVLEHFKGREIRKNRYFYELDQKTFEIDIFLGALWGLNLAKVYFLTEEQKNSFKMPDFAVLDVSSDSFFKGESLVEHTFSDIQKHLASDLK